MPRQDAEAQLRTMVHLLQHESFYVSGTCIDEHQYLYLGWVARKGSFADKMPLHNERGDLTLAFSGEDFPEPGTESRLMEKGHLFEPGTASYLVHLAEEGNGFPRVLNGRFHGCLSDRASGTVTIFNDRYGMHRLYYHQAKDAFYFAAEAKAILAVRPELRALDPEGFAEYITAGCTLENKSLFKGVGVLPPASAWTFRDGELERKAAYFDPKEWEEQSILDEESYYQELRTVFARILPRYFAGNEQIGMSLTGGLDSRMILSWHKAEPGSLPCYTFVGPYRECQDVVIGRRVARAYGQHHQTIPVGREYLSQFPHYSERTTYLTDGYVGVVHSVDLYANERAAKVAPVRVTGNYGGEVLRRVRAFKAILPEDGLYSPDLASPFKGAIATYNKQFDTHPLTFAVFRQAPWHHYTLLSLEQSQLTLRSPFIDNEFVKTVFRAPQSALTNNNISLRLIRDGNPELAKIRTDLGYGGSWPRLPAYLMEKCLDFTFKAEYAYDYGMPQPVAKVDHALRALHLERLFLGRHKFYHFRVWFRDALANYIREMLLDPRTLSRPYLQRSMVEEVVNGHTRGDRNYTLMIHRLLSLEHLHRLFIDAR
jgi:asparagine synthase (glutamine-hydrolysing)